MPVKYFTERDLIRGRAAPHPALVGSFKIKSAEEEGRWRRSRALVGATHREEACQCSVPCTGESTTPAA